MLSPLAVSLGANLIFALFILIALVGLVFGYFTVSGSGINNHPSDGRGAAPGAKLPDEFHQFADRQILAADLREAALDRRIEARYPDHVAVEPQPADDMTIDEVNRKLAAEAAARKAAKRPERDHSRPTRTR